MENVKVFKALGRIAGISGICLGIFYLLFKQLIDKIKIPGLSSNQWFTVIIIFMVLVWIVAIIGLIGYFIYKPGNDVDKHFTKKQKNSLRLIISDITTKLGMVNIELGNEKEVSRKAKKFFSNLTVEPQDQKDFLQYLEYRIDYLEKHYYLTETWKMYLTDDIVKSVPKLEDIQILNELYFPSFKQEIFNYYKLLLGFGHTPPSGWLSEMERIIELESLLCQESANTIYYGIWNIVLSFPKNYFEAFDKQWSQLHNLPHDIPTTEKIAARFLEASLSKAEKYMLDLSSIVGSESLNLKLYQNKIQAIQDLKTNTK